MDVNELRGTIARLKGRIEAESAKAQTKGEKAFGELLSDGLAVLGEALVDLKRIADAADREYKPGSRPMLDPGTLPRAGELADVRVEIIRCADGNVFFKSDDGTEAYRRYADIVRP